MEKKKIGILTLIQHKTGTVLRKQRYLTGLKRMVSKNIERLLEFSSAYLDEFSYNDKNLVQFNSEISVQNNSEIQWKMNLWKEKLSTVFRIIHYDNTWEVRQ